MGKSSFETKTAKVKEHLMSGKSITSWEAIQLYRATRLSAIIFELKNRHGLTIGSETIVDGDTRYSRYYLIADPKIKCEIKDYMIRGNYLTNEVAEQVFNCDNVDLVLKELREEGLNIVGKLRKPLCGKEFTIWTIEK